jgi:predicted DNA-binding transcriptional regulator AlpA
MDHQTVPVEVLREFARSEVELSSIRAAAEDAGVNRSTLHKFITTGRMPHPRVRRLLALWYLRRREGVDEVELIRSYVPAPAVRLNTVPEPSIGHVGGSGCRAGGEPETVLQGRGPIDHQTVPVEVLREFARGEAELSSIRAAAEDAGVNRSSLHKFITAGTMPHPRVRRLLALWYLRRRQGVDEVELFRPYVAALTILLDNMPEPSLGHVRMAVLESIEQGYTAVAEEPPPWVGVLRARLSPKGSIVGLESASEALVS